MLLNQSICKQMEKKKQTKKSNGFDNLELQLKIMLLKINKDMDNFYKKLRKRKVW